MRRIVLTGALVATLVASLAGPVAAGNAWGHFKIGDVQITDTVPWGSDVGTFVATGEAVRKNYVCDSGVSSLESVGPTGDGMFEVVRRLDCTNKKGKVKGSFTVSYEFFLDPASATADLEWQIVDGAGTGRYADLYGHGTGTVANELDVQVIELFIGDVARVKFK